MKQADTSSPETANVMNIITVHTAYHAYYGVW